MIEKLIIAAAAFALGWLGASAFWKDRFEWLKAQHASILRAHEDLKKRLGIR